MSTKQRKPQRKSQILLSVTIFVCMGVCAFFGWHRSRHSEAWNLAFDCLLLLHYFIYYRWWANNDKPVPDTLIRLFPKPTQEAPEKTIGQ